MSDQQGLEERAIETLSLKMELLSESISSWDTLKSAHTEDMVAISFRGPIRICWAMNDRAFQEAAIIRNSTRLGDT